MRVFLCCGAAIAVCAGLVVMTGGQPPAAGKDDSELLQPLEKLLKAFNAADAKGVAAVWSENGEYISEDTNERVEGRKAIEADPKNAGKKPEILQKIAEGKLKTWYAENVLVEQPFVKEESKSVGDLLKGQVWTVSLDNAVVSPIGSRPDDRMIIVPDIISGHHLPL